MTSCGKAPVTDHEDLLEKRQTSYLNYRSNFIELNGLTFHYVDSGEGEVMLFLHGFPYFGESWDKLLKPFSSNYHVVAPDNRGYGYTDKPKQVSDYRIDKLVNDLYQLIDKLSAENKVILVGHDWGGVLAWSIAQSHPELVSKLIIINAPPFNVFLNMLQESPSQKEASSYVGKLDSWISRLLFAIKGPELIWRGLARLHEEGHVDDRFKTAFLAAWAQPGAAEAAINWYKANIPEFDEITDKDYWPQVNTQITVPSLLIWSKHDKAFSEDTFKAIPPLIDNLTIKVIDTSSHAPFLDHTDEVLGYMREFLEE